MSIGSYPPNVLPVELLVPAGDIPGYTAVNKFGRTTDADSSTDRDVWDGTTATWVAPTTARVHDIASSTANDAAAGTGARTIRVYGLTSWSSDEVSEVVSMNGTSNVATSNSYVIIHRIKVLTWGSLGVNDGNITATAQTDSTVTAQVTAGQNQTQMAIYGVPSTKTAYMVQFYASVNKFGAAVNVNMSLLANVDPTTALNTFAIKHTVGIASGGSSAYLHRYNPYNAFPGPCILKMQANASANDTDVSSGFDLILKDN